MKSRAMQWLAMTLSMTGRGNRKRIFVRFKRFSPRNSINVLFCDLIRLKRIFNQKSGYHYPLLYLYIKTPTAQSLRDGLVII